MYMRRDSKGEDIPKNAWKELRCGKLVGTRVGRGSLESYPKAWRHEGMAVWELPMFRRDWNVKSNNRSTWR